MKEIIIEQKNMDFMFVLELEQIILDNVKWNLNLQTPFEIVICLFKELYPETKIFILNNEATCEYEAVNNRFQIALSLIKFGINEFSIYKKYNEYIITISSLLYMLKIEDEIHQMQIVKQIFEEDLELIDECMLKIDAEFNKEEGEGEEEEGEDHTVLVDSSSPLYVEFYFCEAKIQKAKIPDERTATTFCGFYSGCSSSRIFAIQKAFNNQILNTIVQSPTTFTKSKPVLSVDRISDFDENKNNNNISYKNGNNYPILSSPSASKNPNRSPAGKESIDDDQYQYEDKSIGFAEMTPINNSVLTPGRLFFSNIRKLNFSAASANLNGSSGKQRNPNFCNSNFRNRSESFVSTGPGDNSAIDYRTLPIPKKDLFSNTDYNLKFFENNNNNDYFNINSTDKECNDSSLIIENNSSSNSKIHGAAESICKNKDSIQHEIRCSSSKRIDLLRNKRKKCSVSSSSTSKKKNLLLIANSNKAKTFQEDNESLLEEEKENNFSSANIKDINNQKPKSNSSRRSSICSYEKESSNLDSTSKQINIEKIWICKKNRKRKYLKINEDSSLNDQLFI